MGLICLTSGAGYYVGEWLPDEAVIYLIFICWGLLLGTYILREEPVWNLLLLLGFALSGGILLRQLDVTPIREEVWGTIILGLVIALIWGLLSGNRITRAASFLFPATLIYLLGWLLFSIYSLQIWMIRFWAGLGLILFLFIGVSLMGRGKYLGEKVHTVEFANDLFVVLFNLFWLAVVFWGPVG